MVKAETRGFKSVFFKKKKIREKKKGKKKKKKEDPRHFPSKIELTITYDVQFFRFPQMRSFKH